MNVNGVTQVTAANYTTYSKAKGVEENVKKETPAAVYEKSAKSTDRSAVIAKMKLATQQRLDQMQSLVKKMFEQQGITIGTTDQMWRVLAEGKFTADAETIEQAKADIAEDGYWGVKQTSERIFEFAKALADGDPDKMKQMQDAFEKGFKEATKTWGKELPEISSKTYEAVNDMFEEYYAG